MDQYPRWLYSETMPQGVIVQSQADAQTLIGTWYSNPSLEEKWLVQSQSEGAPELVVLSTIAPSHEAAEAIRESFETGISVPPATAPRVDRPVDKRTKAYRNSLV